MYPIGSLIVELQMARRRLLKVFEVRDGIPRSRLRTHRISDRLESIGRLAHMKSSTDIPRLAAIVIVPKRQSSDSRSAARVSRGQLAQ